MACPARANGHGNAAYFATIELEAEPLQQQQLLVVWGLGTGFVAQAVNTDWCTKHLAHATSEGDLI